MRDKFKKDYRGYEILPVRRENENTKKIKYKSNKTQIKKYLEEDFLNKCIYCGWNGLSYDSANFHIEHLYPKKYYPEKIDDYQNMALSCPICNRAKGSKILSDNINPLEETFRDLLYRNSFGAIVVNNNKSVSEKEKANKLINILGLSKEIYKIDYILMSLDELIEKNSDNSFQLQEKNLLEVYQVIREINKIFRRNSYNFKQHTK